MIKTIFFLLQLVIMADISAQDTTTVFVDNKKAGQTVAADNQKGADLVLKKSLYKDLKTLTIQVQSEYMHRSVYKKSLEISGDSSVIVPEITGKPGFFDLTRTTSKAQLNAGKTLKLYLLLDPANPMMMIASRRIYLGDLLMK